mmetsp:Transcript_13192/g.41739  ORF Transcript_13192/g.41739 Transcript_13192/m.41739 type:complete len:225 (-) Transcript_13192:383-1057(-)
MLLMRKPLRTIALTIFPRCCTASGFTIASVFCFFSTCSLVNWSAYSVIVSCREYTVMMLPRYRFSGLTSGYLQRFRNVRRFLRSYISMVPSPTLYMSWYFQVTHAWVSNQSTMNAYLRRSAIVAASRASGPRDSARTEASRERNPNLGGGLIAKSRKAAPDLLFSESSHTSAGPTWGRMQGGGGGAPNLGGPMPLAGPHQDILRGHGGRRRAHAQAGGPRLRYQ